MNSTSCAPSKNITEHNNSCFTLKQLKELAAAYNRYIIKYDLDPNNTKKFGKIKIIKIKPDSTKKYLLEELKKRFEKCENEICITQQNFMREVVGEIREDIADNTFRPEGPSRQTDWLSTQDINSVMRQYEKIYPNFKFIGAVPLDCDEYKFCSLYESNFNFDILQRNKFYHIGIIFNLDRYGKPGSHWVALYMDLLKGEVDYCDSTGERPKGNINNIIEKFKRYCKEEKGMDAVYKVNERPYQKDDSECGVYTCNFIIRRLAGQSFEKIVKDPMAFDRINSCRNKYFRNKISESKPDDMCDPTESG